VYLPDYSISMFCPADPSQKLQVHTFPLEIQKNSSRSGSTTTSAIKSAVSYAASVFGGRDSVGDSQVGPKYSLVYREGTNFVNVIFADQLESYQVAFPDITITRVSKFDCGNGLESLLVCGRDTKKSNASMLYYAVSLPKNLKSISDAKGSLQAIQLNFDDTQQSVKQLSDDSVMQVTHINKWVSGSSASSNGEGVTLGGSASSHFTTLKLNVTCDSLGNIDSVSGNLLASPRLVQYDSSRNNSDTSIRSSIFKAVDSLTSSAASHRDGVEVIQCPDGVASTNTVHNITKVMANKKGIRQC
jgi:hypothetical protein